MRVTEFSIEMLSITDAVAHEEYLLFLKVYVFRLWNHEDSVTNVNAFYSMTTSSLFHDYTYMC